MTTSLNTTHRETGIQKNRSPKKLDTRAYLYWRRAQGEALLAALARHRRETG